MITIEPIDYVLLVLPSGHAEELPRARVIDALIDALRDEKQCELPLVATATAFGMSIRQIRSDRRSDGLVRARECAAMLMRARYESMREIALALDYQDHSSVVHLIRLAKEHLEMDREFRARFERASELLVAMERKRSDENQKRYGAAQNDGAGGVGAPETNGARVQRATGDRGAEAPIRNDRRNGKQAVRKGQPL